LKLTGSTALGACLPLDQAQSASTPVGSDGVGMLVDTTLCIGCRKCEWACSQANATSDFPLERFEDPTVFDAQRRMTASAFTVVNRYPNPNEPERPVFVKFQCMHCVRPACVSACLVGALQTRENGVVTYDAWKCMGCRYCMVACPFQVPAYEYENAFTPRVRKCTFCFERVTQEGKVPACAEICPPMCLTFGKRAELIGLAHEKLGAHPDRYLPHVYGEDEVGGTGWLYLAGRDFAQIGFLALGEEPVPELTETLQHGIFKFGIPPLMLYGLLGLAMWSYREGKDAARSKSATDNSAQ
jgi:Fe-S-cluster-containing dehydrogenase component